MSEPADPTPDSRGDEIHQAGGESILEAISRIAGQAPRIQLRDESSTGANAAPPPSDDDSAVPEMPNASHEIRRLIASGGMGSVYKGRDTELGRDVAIKVLHAQFSSEPAVLQRFVEEAQIGGQLQHPGIVPVYEMGLLADERPFFTMKLVKGRTLSVLLAEREMHEQGRRRFLNLFEAMCQTLAYTHSRGVIHRDLKPANVMVGAFGEVQVVDWGLAKVLQKGATREELREEGLTEISVIETVRSAKKGDDSGSMIGSVLGTPGYMPPEQARGKVEDLDQRCDVFSLGAILCEILTGKPPYPGPRSEALRAAGRGDLDEVEQRLKDCGAEPELIDLCRECLSPAPGARPANAGVLSERLHAHLASVDARGHETRIAAAEAEAKASKEQRARRLTLAVAASVVATVLVGGWLWLWLDSQRAARDAQVAEQVDAALDEADRAGRRSDWTEALAAVERARGLATAGLADAVEAQAGVIEDAARNAAEAAGLSERWAALRSQLRWLASLSGSSTADYGAAYASAFEAAGIEIENMIVDEAVLRLKETDLEVELCLALDEWARQVRRAAGGPNDESKRLLRIAVLTDRDSMRGEIRAAENEEDVDRLRALATVGLDQDAPPATVRALAGALAAGGERVVALDLLRRAAESTRDDHDLHADMARTLLAEQHDVAEVQTVQAHEALEYLTAALALRPSNPVTLRLAARAHALVGDLTEASFRFGAALELDVTLEPALTADGDALDQLLLASSLGQKGRGVSSHEALDRARAMIGDEGATEVLRTVLDTVSGELENTEGDKHD